MSYAPPGFESKICPPEQLTARAACLARPLVFTNGCFDILHRGHVTYLAQAAALGASLVVALNSDASVRRQGKGDERPVNALEDRLAVMAALGCVSLVTWFDEDTPLQRILECRPGDSGQGRRLAGGQNRRRQRSGRLGRDGAFDPLHPSEIDDRAAGENPPPLGAALTSRNPPEPIKPR